MHVINSQTKRQDSDCLRAMYEVAKLDGCMHSVMLGGEKGKTSDGLCFSVNERYASSPKRVTRVREKWRGITRSHNGHLTVSTSQL